MLLDAEEDAACARFSGGTLFLHIRPAGVVHRCDPHQSCLTMLSEIFEMCLNAFGGRTPFMLASSAKLREVANPHRKSTHIPGTEQPSIAQLMVTLKLPTPSLRTQRTTPKTNGRLRWTRHGNERNLTRTSGL